MMNFKQYAKPMSPQLPQRKWPSAAILKSPEWCAVDLRDGNQALAHPMNGAQKLEYFQLLCRLGFKQIEIGFPASSKEEFNFCRKLIEDNLIPEDVTISVLTQARSSIVKKTMDALAGVKQAICHVYIPTSRLHYQYVLGKSWSAVEHKAISAVAAIRDYAASMKKSRIDLEFSAEEFTDSDVERIAGLCDKVIETWNVNRRRFRKVIVNLPCTVERMLPTHYPDMIEAACAAMKLRRHAVISLHCHNDMGGAVASTEMALQAGGERVEGTLFGNGERSGNVDLVTLALNMEYLGLPTGLDLSNLPEVMKKVSQFTGMSVYPRQPYSGELAYASFAGSHQDAIHKVMKNYDEVVARFGGWKMPYMHIDPADIGRNAFGAVRYTSQSGRGGIAHILMESYGVQLPEALLSELYSQVQAFAECVGRELLPEEIWTIFLEAYNRTDAPFHMINFWPRPDADNPALIHAEVHCALRGRKYTVVADGDGPIAAFAEAVRRMKPPKFRLVSYEEKALGVTVKAESITIVSLENEAGRVFFGVGFGANIVQGAARAIISAINRMMTE